MLLGDLLLRRERAAKVWLVRERTEHEAASLFAGLAADLEASGMPAQLVELARRCGEDELVHAQHCRSIVESLSPALAPLAPDAVRSLGPSTLDAADRALYTSVALGCVTESLSTALLIELRPHVRDDVVRRGLDVIVRDEVRHARLGWAHLARAASERDVGWVAEHVPAMLRAALDTEQIDGADERLDLRAWGILPREDVARICRATIETTIAPGLRMHGIEIPAFS